VRDLLTVSRTPSRTASRTLDPQREV